MAKKRNGALDFQKFLFAVLVVIFHGKNVSDSDFWFRGGSIGVEFFFLVSGAMMALSAQKITEQNSVGKDTMHFMKHKILGLCPNIYVAWVIAFVVRNINVDSFFTILQHGADSLWELLFLSQSGLLTWRANSVTWYLSAMLLAMLILYPLLKKFGDNFFYIIAPIGFILMMGMSYQNYSNLRLPSAWNGWILKGFYRAIMEILGGCLCFRIAQSMRAVSWTVFTRILFTIAEWGAYIFVIAFSFNHGGGKMDWILVLLLMIGITITLSQSSLDETLFSADIFNWLGIYSYSLFLGHGYWSQKLTEILPDGWGTYPMRLFLYMVISIVTGIVIMYVSIGLKHFWKIRGKSIKQIFITDAHSA